jgi:DNA-binding transcriptional ArsR family regulator
MSLEAMSWVFDLRKPTLGTRLVLLSLADNAGAKADFDDQHIAWPSVRKLAYKAVLSERQVQRALKMLADGGYITDVGSRDSGVRMWRLELAFREGGDNLSPPDAHVTGGVTPMSPESEVEPQEEGSNEPSPSEPLGEIAKEGLRPQSSHSNGNVNQMVPPGPGSTALCRRLAELMLANDPKAKVEPESKRWLDAARLLVDSDGRHFEEALAVLEWCQRDEFWRTNVLSMPTFRKQYAKLRMRWMQERHRAALSALSQRSTAAAPASSADLIAGYEKQRSRTGL